MDTLFDFEDQPQEQQGLKDWSGNPIPVSPNPCIRLYGADPGGRKCKDCNHLIRDYHHGTTYPKCELRKLTRGPGSDHRVRWDACKRFEQEEPEPPNQPYSPVCPQCQGPIELLYTWGVWSCDTCKIKIAQTKEEGITRIEPLAVFGFSPLERSKEQ